MKQNTTSDSQSTSISKNALNAAAATAVVFSAAVIAYAQQQMIHGDINSANNTLTALFVTNAALVAAAVLGRAKM
jgi:hypothetical protein